MSNESRPRLSSRISDSFKKILGSSPGNVYDPRRPGGYHRAPIFRPPSVYMNTQQEMLFAKRRRYDEMLHRVPDVPWLAILDWILRPPLGDQDINVIIQEAKAAERARLALRRVCKSWKAHVDAMRCFVDVTELVVHGRPIELARKARVVSCRQAPDGQGPDTRALLESMEAILSDYTQIEVIRLFTEVRTQQDPRQYVVLNNFNPDWTRLTHLKVGTFFASRDIPPTGAGLGLPTVQHLEYLHDGPGLLQGQGWWLPALRTLKIGLINNPEDFAVLVTVLESVGANITLLEIIRTYPPPPLFVLAILWRACPRLETFAANFWGLGFEESPPLSSPLCHLIDTGQSMEKCANAVRSIAELYWPSLHRITVPSLSWAGELPLQMLQQAPGGQVVMDLSVDLSGRDVRLEDRMGRTLYETDVQGEFWRYASRRGGVMSRVY